MSDTRPQMMDVGEGASRRRIAWMHAPGASADAAGLFWLSGLKSEMTSTKATALAAFAAHRGLAYTRLDYSGHGQSEGRFEDGTIGRWLEEAVAVFRAGVTGPVVVVGSSMGGWIALLLLRRLMREEPALAARILGLVLVAPAWDMTEELMWNTFSAATRREMMEKGVVVRPSEYGDGGYALTRALIEEGRGHLIRTDPFDPARPVRVLQGLQDPDVPWEHALELESLLTGGHVRIVMVPDGEHRLSRPQDLEMLFGLVAEVLETRATGK